MPKYEVRSGQNIYDVAITLYGSVEGIFDLLVRNDWLSMDVSLQRGMILEYGEDFVINQDLPIWFRDNGIIVKNGEHVCAPVDTESIIQNHFQTCHPKLLEELAKLSPDERTMYWDTINVPAMMIDQQGQLSNLKFKLKNGTHLIIDWGDTSEPELIDSEEDTEIEHCYKGSGRHIIVLHGDCEFEWLDLTHSNGIHYPLKEIIADSFTSLVKIDKLNQLIIQNEKC